MMGLLDKRGAFIYQVRPSLFPEGELTATEMLLWNWFYEEKNEQLKSKQTR